MSCNWKMYISRWVLFENYLRNWGKYFNNMSCNWKMSIISKLFEKLKQILENFNHESILQSPTLKGISCPVVICLFITCEIAAVKLHLHWQSIDIYGRFLFISIWRFICESTSNKCYWRRLSKKSIQTLNTVFNLSIMLYRSVNRFLHYALH